MIADVRGDVAIYSRLMRSDTFTVYWYVIAEVRGDVAINSRLIRSVFALSKSRAHLVHTAGFISLEVPASHISTTAE